MAQVSVIGRITADLEPRISQQGNPYVCFSIAEHFGSGTQKRTQFFRVWACGQIAVALVRANPHKGTQIAISGKLELEEYQKKDGVSLDKRMKITLQDWRLAQGGSPSQGGRNAPSKQAAVEVPVCIDGDKETLPE